MMHPVLIAGGGLAGLTAARLLHRAGFDFVLLEARERLGGRILSADAAGDPSDDGFDLGPSWFWPGMHPAMAALVEGLGLSGFPQASEGDVIVQRTPRDAPQRYRGLRQEPQSMRLAGGTGALIRALAADLPASRLRLDARVRRVVRDGQEVEVSFAGADGPERTIRASHVVFALPPRLLEAGVSFSPALDAATIRRWRETPTWMAPHAKVFALYDRPFWRDAGLSGMAQSMTGPLVEVHDATTASGKAALFGFVGVPAEQRRVVGQDAIVRACVQQLAALFGPEAASPVATLFKDWAADPLTATADDRVAGGHPRLDPRPWVSGAWQDHLFLAGSETSSTAPGYLAGAVEAAGRAVTAIVRGPGASAAGASDGAPSGWARGETDR
ncbi:MAG TPA: FAD-dependent oxidoreductase [Microvirga sp.]|jgi:monoamine oxidase|nr:FAD-dependent oxidoreductase [Microvirga sp.]